MSEFNTIVGNGEYKITFETDNKIAYQQVETLCRLIIDGKSGEAIPIEWLKKCKDRYILCCTIIDDIIEEWREENGKV